MWANYALVGLVTVLLWLLKTNKASLNGNGGRPCLACGDNRLDKTGVVFGGASAFTCGSMYYLLAWLFPQAQSFLSTYGHFQLILSLIQAVLFLVQAKKITADKIRIGAHDGGCGFTTGWGPFWPLFFLGKIKVLAPYVLSIRDFLTVVDLCFSLPLLGALSLITKFWLGKWTVPRFIHL